MNIFRRLFSSKRREKKNKPVPVVPHKEPIRQKPEPPEPKIKAVTYNRVDGRVSGGPLTPKRAIWDDDSQIYKGKALGRRSDDNEFEFYADSTRFDDAFFYQSEETGPERGYAAQESASGYDYTPQPVSEPYVAPSPSYEAPAYTPSYSPPSYSPSSGSDSGSSSYSSSDSGGGGYSSD